MDDQQVADLIHRALAAVKSAKTPPALQEIAFTAALGLLMGNPIQLPKTGNSGAEGKWTHSPSNSNEETGSVMLDKVAIGLGLNAKQVVHLFADKNGVPELKAKSSKIPSQKATGARDIALLVMAARQLGGIDEYTELGVLRDAAKHYSRLDSKNFAKHMKALDHCTITANGAIKLTNPGIDEASDLAHGYVGELQ